ncbi:MAG: AI-2E family transporter [Verrucomicrobia bacterium]|nr:AI-2E family transporter [Verrucomicrobiota bacterium]
MNPPVSVTFQGKRFSKWIRFGLPLLSLFLLWLLYHEAPLLFSSLVISFGLFYILNPVVDFLEAHSLSRIAASALVLAGLVAVMYLMWMRVLSFSTDIRAQMDLDVFQRNLVGTAQRVIVWVEVKMPVLKRFIEPETETLAAAVVEPARDVALKKRQKSRSGTEEPPPPPPPKPKTLPDRIEEFIAKQLMAVAPDLAKKLLGLLPNLILIPYFTFFLLKDGRSFRKTLIAWIPNRYFEPALKFFYELDRRMRSYFQSLMLDCVLVGVLVGVGSALVGAPYPVVFGLLACILNSIPLLGPLLYGLICLVITIGAGRPLDVVFGFAGVFVLSRICDDLVFQPTIYGKSHHIHPVVVVCAVLLGETVAGVWGMFLAIPITSILLLGLDIVREISMGEDTPPLPPSAFAPFA